MRPPTIVIDTGICSICFSGHVRMSSGSTTRSASLPGSIEPLMRSSNVRYALLMVSTCSASLREIFCSALHAADPQPVVAIVRLQVRCGDSIAHRRRVVGAEPEQLVDADRQ